MDSDGIEYNRRIGIELKLKSVCTRKLLETTARNNNWTRHTEVAGFLHNREFDYVTENIVRATNTKDIYFFPWFSHSKKISKIIIFSRCCWSLFLTVTVCREHDASFSHSSFLSQILNSQFPTFRSKRTSLSYIKEDSFKNDDKVSQDTPLVKYVKKFERIFSFELRNNVLHII